ncbi:MAG TPA: HD domain-containing phosphohydrolase [Mycobacteriales bacterium]|nr:HD domain-containing phosphohydrolase [Mycobacteriales bacterium]
MQGGLSLAEVAALLAVAQDYSFGQPAGAQLRAAVLAQEFASAAGFDELERGDVWWTSTLRFLGCTGHAYETALVLGDEIDLRARSLRFDSGNLVEVFREMLNRAGPGRSGLGRVGPMLGLLATGKRFAAENFRAACEVADAFALRLQLSESVRGALAANFERWNGRGLPAGLEGAEIPRPMRLAQISQEFEVYARFDGVDTAVRVVGARSGKSYDPTLAHVVCQEGPRVWGEVGALDPWDEALSRAPSTLTLDPAATRECLLVLADFADLKSPWTIGHSRAVAELVGAVCGDSAADAALVHDLGRVAVANTVWDKAGSLTRDERDRVETHTLVTDQLLRRIPYLCAFADIAVAAHERLDGSGYHRRLGGGHLAETARVLAAADCYQAMVSERPHRAAHSPVEAAAELRAMAKAGMLGAEAIEGVLAAAGHPRSARAAFPGGLTAREAEVLGLLARGLTTRQIAARLVISPKTADHHIQSIYSKIGSSTRGAAALFATEHGLVAAAPE